MNTAKANFKRAYSILRAANRDSTTLGVYDPIAVYLVGYSTEDGWVHSYECDSRDVKDSPEFFGKLRAGLHYSDDFLRLSENLLEAFPYRIQRVAMHAFSHRLWCEERPPVPAIERKALRELQMEQAFSDDAFIRD